MRAYRKILCKLAYYDYGTFQLYEQYLPCTYVTSRWEYNLRSWYAYLREIFMFGLNEVNVLDFQNSTMSWWSVEMLACLQNVLTVWHRVSWLKRRCWLSFGRRSVRISTEASAVLTDSFLGSPQPLQTNTESSISNRTTAPSFHVLSNSLSSSHSTPYSLIDAVEPELLSASLNILIGTVVHRPEGVTPLMPKPTIGYGPELAASSQPISRRKTVMFPSGFLLNLQSGDFQRSRIWGFHSGGYEEYHLLGYDAV
jgi:hypothetical protein